MEFCLFVKTENVWVFQFLKLASTLSKPFKNSLFIKFRSSRFLYKKLWRTRFIRSHFFDPNLLVVMVGVCQFILVVTVWLDNSWLVFPLPWLLRSHGAHRAMTIFQSLLDSLQRDLLQATGHLRELLNFLQWVISYGHVTQGNLQTTSFRQISNKKFMISQWFLGDGKLRESMCGEEVFN